MKTDFKLTEKSNVIILKILKSVSIILAGFICIVYLKHCPAGYFYGVLASGTICILLFYSLPGYQVIGKITFDPEALIIDANSLTIEKRKLPVILGDSI